MAVSEVSICNLALSWMGGNRIVSLDDDTPEARHCKANFDFSRDAVLEERFWTFAGGRKIIPKETDVPVFGYSSSFPLPPDCLIVRSAGADEEMNDPDFVWEREGNRILADLDLLYILYTRRVTNPVLFTPGFCHALAARLAMDISLPLTESPDMFKSMASLYDIKLDRAGASDGMQGRNQKLRSTRLHRIR